MEMTFYIFVFFFGAIIGSFLNVCICRLPEGKSVIWPASHCPYCQTQIKWYDNIPLLSFLLLKGHCRYCGKPISWQYPVVELSTGIFTLLIYWKYGLSLPGLIYLLFVCALIVVSFIDLKLQIIPDVISIPGIFCGLIASFFLPELSLKDALYGALLGGGILFLVAYGYYLIRKKEGMGGGDIKLLAMIGAFLGWKAIPFVILIASLTGSFIGILWIFLQKKDKYFPIPFGPFLALGAICLLFFPQLIHISFP
ncbi:MAG: prepilin peptidase [Candidatus Desulfofervidaceae bacterium]|nr:prepilin peptidase [Candidatus Desulfofervidaceae bacterium]MDL1970781.1 prepilin peptidase [Candidatus Desulfofervidaceae bacterium]